MRVNNMDKKIKVSFMFGAGAENGGNFNIQNGNNFLINTIYIYVLSN